MLVFSAQTFKLPQILASSWRENKKHLQVDLAGV